MSDETAFVGDIHGNLAALRGLSLALAAFGQPHVVYLGDYVNKGQHSAEVMEELVRSSQAGHATLLKGNHEAALLDAFETADLSAFLKMGGSMTIRSYVGRDVKPDVLADFKAAFPNEHLEAIRQMAETYETTDVIAQHGPTAPSTRRFRISAHVPVGEVPRIGSRSAEIDTSSGAESGRLTALLWPSLNYVQVDTSGVLVPN